MVIFLMPTNTVILCSLFDEEEEEGETEPQKGK